MHRCLGENTAIMWTTRNKQCMHVHQGHSTGVPECNSCRSSLNSLRVGLIQSGCAATPSPSPPVLAGHQVKLDNRPLPSHPHVQMMLCGSKLADSATLGARVPPQDDLSAPHRSAIAWMCVLVSPSATCALSIFLASPHWGRYLINIIRVYDSE